MAAKVLSWAGLQWTSASRKYILTRTTRLSLYKIITHQDHLQDYFQDHHMFIITRIDLLIKFKIDMFSIIRIDMFIIIRIDRWWA